MTEKQLEVLRSCENGVHFYDDLDNEGRLAISYLESEKLCFCKALSPPIYQITGKGQSELKKIDDALNEKREKAAQEKIEKKSDRTFQLLNSFFQVVLGAVLTLLIEHIIIPLLSK